ncbi:MAG: hypothetical protein QF464_24105, partial [Myxococcota bacterium]|nr:hypothetical protein [Myxococcota bacterium]
MLGLLTLVNLAMYPVIPQTIKVPSPHYHHDLLPNVDMARTWGELSHPMATNALGFEDRTVREVPMKTDKVRILFIGDSFTEGLGYSFDETFVGRFAAGLDPARYEVLNASASSYSPKLYYHKVRHLI